MSEKKSQTTRPLTGKNEEEVINHVEDKKKANPNEIISSRDIDEEVAHSNEPSQKDIYEMVREQVKHEDELINQRTNLLLICQGFLFVAYTTLLGSNSKPANYSTVITLISMTGIFLSIFTLVGIRAAFAHMEKLRVFWERVNTKNQSVKNNHSIFPPMMGTGKIIKGGTAPTAIPILLIVVWLWLMLS